MKFILLGLLLLTAACSPLSYATTTPAVALGVYDSFNKRTLLLERADKGDVYAQYELAESYMYRPTEGTQSFVEASKWYCKAAQNGSPEAMLKLGKVFEKGYNLADGRLKLDKSKALAMYMMADWRASLEGSDERKLLQNHSTFEEIGNARNYAYYFDFHDCGKILTE